MIYWKTIEIKMGLPEVNLNKIKQMMKSSKMRIKHKSLISNRKHLNFNHQLGRSGTQTLMYINKSRKLRSYMGEDHLSSTRKIGSLFE